MKEARALEAEMQEFAERRIGQLKQEDMKIRQTLYEEISTVVRDHALKANGFDIVFDKTGRQPLHRADAHLHVKEGAATDITRPNHRRAQQERPASGPPKPAKHAAPAGDAKK
jgi:hypothetical protein